MTTRVWILAAVAATGLGSMAAAAAQAPAAPKVVTVDKAVSYTHLTLPTNREV